MAILMYCKKCGRIILNSYDELEYYCDCCSSITYQVPEKYCDELKFLISNDKKQLLREELVKTSPEFDQQAFDNRDKILAENNARYNQVMAYGKAILEEKSRVPKCPVCGSANISKIGILNRMVSTGVYGLASSKIGKTHKCNNCGTTW